MASALPAIPPGNGKHPVSFVVFAAKHLAASTGFYSKLFGWQIQALSAELAAGMGPGGPAVALRANQPEGAQTTVAFIAVPGVDAALERVVAAGGQVERAPWSIPILGRLARFKDPSGTVYGLYETASPTPQPRMPMPFGDNPRPPAGAICSLEMHAASGEAAARFFGEVFGWGALATMPQYMAFDPGAGPGGVFQSHTPAAPALAYVYSGDVAATLAAAEAAGATRMGDPMAVPGMGTFGYFLDPSGTGMGLMGP